MTKRYGRRRALSDLDLEIPGGCAFGLLGPNGAGKTTALRLLLGLARPSSGSVRLHERPAGDPAARRGVGYLPERLVLPRRMTVRRCLSMHAQLAGLDGAEGERHIAAALRRTGLEERQRERIGGLSKGLTQRMGFAIALLGDPDLLVLDEPTSGLDPLGIRDARSWMLEAKRRGATLLVSSHTLSEVERTCDRVTILDGGRVAASGSLDELAAPGETLEDVFVRTVRG